MQAHRKIGAFWALAALLGCAGGEPDGLRSEGHALTADELDQKTLSMLNHETTDLKVLDVDAALTATAAKNLIAHRDGSDGLFGTPDDDLFETIVEVDDVKGVGPFAMGKLRAFAETWTPKDPNQPPDEPVGIDAKVLAMLNHQTTTLTILDVDASLSATAAKRLIGHRDGADGLFGTADDDLFDSMTEVDDVKYVGKSAIAALKAYAESWTEDTNSTSGPKDVPKVLLFLNDPLTTLTLLLKSVGLTTTQANNVIAWRDGPDGVLGTDDDNLFDTIDELDSVKYIGVKTIAKIETYAADWEPVDPAQALEEKVLAFLNHESTTVEVLDVAAGLTSTAAKAIVAARDGADGLFGTDDDVLFTSMQQVDDVKYVGPSALAAIKAYAMDWDPDQVVEPTPMDAPLSCKQCGIFAGEPTEYDPGPPAGSGWAELFAAVPNFRVVSAAKGEEWLTPDPSTGMTKLDSTNAELAQLDPPQEIPSYTLTSKKFRYHMGPLFYRGRLDGTARVLIVGQEGATDEALVHRAFVGGTGQKVQNWMNAIGITQSYIMVNTFVYSIYEQYDAFAAELALQSAIKDHRNQILAKIFAENDIQLVATFGNAAYQSVKVFREELYGGKFPKGTRWTHMMHPGAAALSYAPDSSGTVIDAGTIGAVVKSMADSWKRVWYWRYIDPGWLAPDPDGWTFQSSKFYFGDRDIPYRDLPYGASPQVGRGGTKSERSKGGLQVQLRSQNGVRYEAPAAAFPSTPPKADSGFAKAIPEEVSWEPPKFEPDTRHDRGPDPDWAALFAETPSQETCEQESAVDANNDFERIPLWYRGRINGAPWLLVVAQDYGSDQIIAGRTLVGDAGQKLADLLENIGADDNYLVINPYPYSVNGTVADLDVLNLALSPSLAAYRKALLEKILAEKPITAVVTLGEIAEAAWADVGAGFPGEVWHLAHPREASAPLSWNAALPQIQAVAADLGLSGGAFEPYPLAGFEDIRVQIPREDLPWGVPLWFGTSGDLSQQPTQDWVFWNAPKWVKYEAKDGGVPSAPAP